MMRLSPADLLTLCSDYGAAPIWARCEALVALIEPVTDEPMGARNARLMQIRRANLGRKMTCLTGCPSCGETMEIVLDTLDFEVMPQSERVVVDVQGQALSFRLPTTREIALAARQGNPLAVLLNACVINPPPGIQMTDPDLLNSVEKAFDAADPLGCIAIEATCADCGAVAQPVLDPAYLVWSEFAALALRIEDDVHVLARAYGWAEAEILALPEVRRRRYVERVLQ